MNNESSLLINSPFALRQQNLKPVFTRIKTIQRAFTDNEIEDLMNQQVERDRKAGLPEKRIKHHCSLYMKFLKNHTKKIEVKEDYPLDLHSLERIIITPCGTGYVSTAFLGFMKEFNVPIYFINGKGMIESCFMPMYFKKPSLVIKQVESRINGRNVEIAKYLINLKIESQGINHLIPKLNNAKDIKDVLAVEANASRIYFQQWELPVRFNWKGRRGRTLNINAVDPINAALNLGYSLLAQQVSEILLKRGYELSIGFMHCGETKVYWNQLSYDMLEPYRIWIDQAVKDMVKNLKIEPEDFIFSKDRSSMIFKNEPFEIAVERFMEVLSPLEHKSLPLIRKIEGML